MERFEELIGEFEKTTFTSENQIISFSNKIELQAQSLKNVSQALFKVLQARFQQAQQQKLSQFTKLTNMDVIDILKDIKNNLQQENVKAEMALNEICNQTQNLQAIGVSADRIQGFATQGHHITKGVRYIEQRDKMLTYSLFGIFVLSSIFIVLRRIFRHLK